MALTDESNGGGTGMVMPVSPMYGNGGNGNGFMGNDSGWWFILLILAMFGGWGNGFGGGYGNGALASDAAVMYPWMNQAGLINSGFDNAALTSSISGIQSAVTSGFGDVQNALCSGFAGVNAGIANGFAQAEIANNARQIANMQTSFANQTAMNQGFNSLASQFADCCCENRLASADLKYTIAQENCADRTALSDGIRDVLTAQSNGIQRILDQMCSDKLEQKNDIINQLRSELMYARGQASQDVQTAAIQAGQRTLANEIEQYVLPTPRPSYIVANPHCCPTNTGCGCGF